MTRRSGGNRRYSVVDDGQEDPLGAGDGSDGHECGGWGVLSGQGRGGRLLGSSGQSVCRRVYVGGVGGGGG